MEVTRKLKAKTYNIIVFRFHNHLFQRFVILNLYSAESEARLRFQARSSLNGDMADFPRVIRLVCNSASNLAGCPIDTF